MSKKDAEYPINRVVIVYSSLTHTQAGSYFSQMEETIFTEAPCFQNAVDIFFLF